jgi:hypothetical protein
VVEQLVETQQNHEVLKPYKQGKGYYYDQLRNEGDLLVEGFGSKLYVGKRAVYCY